MCSSSSSTYRRSGVRMGIRRSGSGDTMTGDGPICPDRRERTRDRGEHFRGETVTEKYNVNN